MSNKVSYIIQLKDRFSRVGEKFERQFRDIEQATDKATTKLAKFQKRADGIGKNLAKKGAALTAATTAPFVIMANKLTQSAADSEESKAKFNAVFNGITESANIAAKDYAKSFGVAGSTARDMLSSTGDLLSGFGFSDQMSLDLSRQVAELGADLAAFQNLEGGAADAADRLTRALLGETESAKALGIVIRQNTKEFRDEVKATAASMRISGQQAKAIVILKQAVKQSANAIGATGREWDEYNSVSRRAKERTKEMSASFGLVLIPIMTKLKVIQEKVAEWFLKLSPTTKKWLVIVAGLVAVIGPLVLLVGGLAAAFALVSLPAIAIVAAVAAIAIGLYGLYKAIMFVKDNWSSAMDWMSAKVDAFVAKVVGAAEKVKSLFSLSDDPMSTGNKIVGTAGIMKDNILGAASSAKSKVRSFLGLGSDAPTTPVPANGTVNGNITVSATGGAQVRSTSITNQGAGMNLGLNMGGM